MFLNEYRRLEGKLKTIRATNGGQESVEEDGILDDMDAIWVMLTHEEQEKLKSEGPST